MKTIAAILPSYSQYQSAHFFIRFFALAAHREGFQVALLDSEKLGFSGIVESVFELNPDFVFSMNQLGISESGRSLADEVNCPYVAYLIDPPHQYISQKHGNHLICACVDRELANFLEKKLGLPSFFLPHAVNSEVPSLEERPLEAVLLASCIDPDVIVSYLSQQFPSDLCLALEAGVELAYEDRERSLLQHLIQQGEERGMQELVDWKHPSFSALWYFGDLLLRGKDRIALLQSMTNLSIHVYGNGVLGSSWKHLEGLGGHVTVHDAVEFPEALDLMSKSKFVLNSFPSFSYGVHERVLYGMACGAVVVTNKNDFIESEFTEEELLTFDSRTPQEVVERVSLLLENESERFLMALEGQEKVLQSHTWDVRVAQLLDSLEGIKKE